MHKVIKKKNGKRIKAWRLGQNSQMEQMLMSEKKIRLLGDGTYRLASLEAVRAGSGGEKADAGDWFRIEERGNERFPYPITNEYFTDNFRRVRTRERDDEFEAIPKILDAWFADDAPSEEVNYLLDTGKLSLTDDSLVALNWGTTLVAPRKGSAVIFYSIKTSNGELFIDFNLVDAEAFRRDYEILD